MRHESQKAMMFYMLCHVNYNQPWEAVEMELGYNLGDFAFTKPGIQDKIIQLAKQNWIELQGFFNEEGN